MRVPILSAALAAALIFGATASAQAETAAAAPTADQTAAVAAPVVAPADQATPNPNATPAGQTNPRPGAPQNPTPGSAQSPSGGPTQTRATPAPARPVSHLPIIDFVVTFTQPAYYGNRNAIPAFAPSVINQYDPVDVGGTVRIPVTRKLNLLFDRVTEGTLNQPLDCILQPSSPAPGAPAARVCSSDSRDILLQYHATYAFDRFLTMDVGDSFRHRIWANGGTVVSNRPFPTTINSTEHHFGYLGFTYTTKPWRDFWNSQFAFAETVDRQNVDHHVTMVCSAALIAALTAAGARNQLTCPNGVGTVGFYDGNPRQNVYYETTQGVTWILPVDPRHGTSFTLNERWGALNFYENATINPAFGTTIIQPYRWNSALTYQLNKRFSPGFTLALRHSDFHSSPNQSTPFVSPNSIHVGSWDVIGTFHVDTNTWFGTH